MNLLTADRIMKTFVRISYTTACACVLLSVLPFLLPSAQAQVEAAKPGPKHEQLRVWVGEWTYEGVQHETSFGPKGEFKGKMVNRFILGGFVLESDWVEEGGAAGKEMHCYDAAKDQYVTYSCDNSGGVSVMVDVFQGNTVTGRGTHTDGKGTRSMTRASCVFQPGGDKFRSTFEVSLDEGKTWVLWWELTATKVKP